MASPQKARIPVGFVIAGKYRTTGELGRGGMASVYEAENVDIGKRVAIKVLAQELTSSTIVVERFLREARAVAAIRSPYICDVYDSGRLEDGRPFLVLELLEGESLYERMVRLGQIDVDTTVQVMAQTCKGLVKAHAAGIVHRDLKPENIFVTKNEEGKLLAKVLDFGLAKFYAPVEEGTEQARLTRDGAVFGTPAYMSPEQVRGQGAVDARADLWALGCITYECLTGRTVWSTDQGVAMTFAQIAQGVLPDPGALRTDLPAGFKAWFEKALHRDIAQRFQSPKEFADELLIAMDMGTADSRRDASQEILLNPRASTASKTDVAPLTEMKLSVPDADPPRNSSGETPQPSVPEAPVKKSGGGGTAFLVVALAGLVGGGGYWFWRNQNPPVDPPLVTSASASTTSDPTATPEPTASAPPVLSHSDGLPFRPLVAEAQDLIVKGDLDGARAKIKQAVDLGAHYMPQTFAQHLDAVAKGNAKPPTCALRGLGRPRTYDLMEEKAKRRPASWPSIGVGTTSTVMAFTEVSDGKQIAWTVGLDEAMRAKTEAIEVTPEGLQVQRPELTAVGDKFLLTYWDTAGPESGVYARFLDETGRIASPPTLVAKAVGGASFPAIAPTSEGFVFTWVEPTDKNTEDFYARLFDASMKPLGEKVRLTVFKPTPSNRTRLRAPSLSIDGDALRLFFRLERDPDRIVELLTVPLASIREGAKIEGAGGPVDKYLGALELVSPPKFRADSPTLGCIEGVCLAAYNEESKDGIFVAPTLSGQSKPLFKGEFIKGLGRRPALATDGAHKALQLFFYERGKLQTAAVDRDGAKEPSTIARMTTQDQTAPTARPGRKPGEWFVVWSDFEGGQPEVFVARVECK
jgi:eukaryotic-like serine/threonine-protein kinase